MAMTHEDRDQLVRLERAVASMASPAREAFLMHRLESLGYPEIGERLGLTVAEVERCIADAMLHLVRAMEGDPGNRGA